MTGPNPASAAAHAACEHLYRGFSRWLGAEGCRALSVRVLRNTQKQQPALAGIEIGNPGDGWGLAGVSKAVAEVGDTEVAAALEVLLTELIDLLGRFVGADMVVTLAEPSRPADGSGGVGGKEA
ncbi:MAG TPA: hypothetical protein VMN78_02755 [Longimicrobiales bacterium]|nr:hypothetical protein [Longimicrobiales bacterium]